MEKNQFAMLCGQSFRDVITGKLKLVSAKIVGDSIIINLDDSSRFEFSGKLNLPENSLSLEMTKQAMTLSLEGSIIDSLFEKDFDKDENLDPLFQITDIEIEKLEYIIMRKLSEGL